MTWILSYHNYLRIIHKSMQSYKERAVFRSTFAADFKKQVL